MISDDPARIGNALAAYADALAEVIAAVTDERLEELDDDQLLAYLKFFESTRNQSCVVDQQLIHALDKSNLPRRMAKRNTSRFLVEMLHIPAGEAHRRVRAAKALHADRSMLGERLEPNRPILAAAVATGDVTPNLADECIQSLKKLDQLPWTDAELVSQAEQDLTEAARSFAPDEFAQVKKRIEAHLNPDGTLADDQQHQAARNFYLWQSRDGRYHVKGDLTQTLGNKLTAVLGPLAKPQNGPDGEDLRSAGQRQHDVVDEVFSRMLRSGDVPDAGGMPATVVVTIDYDNLIAKTGYGNFGDGTPIAPETLLKMADEAQIIPAVLNSHGAVLCLGLEKRYASKAQTAALIARDGGCSFPGCDRPPCWCDRHHVIAWQDGGPTDVENLTLLCLFHHHQFEDQGWTCRMINGLPHWIPPRWLDHDQQPLLNYRIQDRNQRRKKRRPPPGESPPDG